MLAEFLKALTDWAKRSNEPVVYRFHEDLDEVNVYTESGLACYPLPAPPKLEVFNTLTSLVQFAADAWTTDKPAAMFVDESCITFVRDVDERRDCSRLDLFCTETWRALCELARTDRATAAKTQAEAIRLLRNVLNAPADGLVSQLRRVDFARLNSGQGTVEHGRESLGRSVENKVQGVGELPDRFTYTAFPFVADELAAIEVHVEMALEIDPGNERPFVIRPAPNAMVRARRKVARQVVDVMRALLAKESLSMPVFEGTCSMRGETGELVSKLQRLSRLESAGYTSEWQPADMVRMPDSHKQARR